MGPKIPTSQMQNWAKVGGRKLCPRAASMKMTWGFDRHITSIVIKAASKIKVFFF